MLGSQPRKPAEVAGRCRRMSRERGGAASVLLPAAGAPRTRPQGGGALHRTAGIFPWFSLCWIRKILGSQTVLWPPWL